MRGYVLFSFLLLITLGFESQPAHACDPNEACGDSCAFHVCVHDYACEGRKAACHIPIAGPVFTAPGTPLGTGGLLGPGGPGLGPVSGEDLKKCVATPSNCGSVIIGDIAFSAVAPIIDQYISNLNSQADGKWKSLPTDVISTLQPFYPEIDLNGIQYAENINTIHGQNMTIENEIFFTGKMDFTRINDDSLLSHELEHSVQYHNRGGRAGFLAEYIAKGAGQIISTKSIDIHNDIDFERDAIAKATAVMSALGWMPLQNGYWRYSGGHGWLTGLVVKGDSNSGSNGGSTADTPIPFGPANGDTLVSTQWIALQDPGSNGSFFKNGDVAISASTLQKGDEVYSDRDINVRSSAADWKDKPLYVLPRGTRVHIDEVKALRAGSTTQLWGAVDVDGSVKR